MDLYKSRVNEQKSYSILIVVDREKMICIDNIILNNKKKPILYEIGQIAHIDMDKRFYCEKVLDYSFKSQIIKILKDFYKMNLLKF
jgi:hypothetical protein